MADRDQRDRAIERVLRSGASAGAGASVSAGAGVPCIDGETLAAWSSGTLARGDVARVEEHLADCARCQAMLAAFARTEPVTAAPTPWRQRAQIRWLVPLATAAVIGAIWVAVPQRNEPVRPLADARAPLEAERPAAPVEAVPLQPAPSARNQAAPMAQTAPPKREADAVLKREEESTRAAAPAAPAPTQTLQERMAVGPETRELFAKSTAPEFASPDGTTRWRIVGGQVQRSTTQGKSWDAVTLPSTATITAGHSPAPSIVWLVGKSGVIFVTTDGTSFERVPFPSSSDLRSVMAVDGRQATVATVEGRIYGTSDRGISWIQP